MQLFLFTTVMWNFSYQPIWSFLWTWLFSLFVNVFIFGKIFYWKYNWLQCCIVHACTAKWLDYSYIYAFILHSTMDLSSSINSNSILNYVRLFDPIDNWREPHNIPSLEFIKAHRIGHSRQPHLAVYLPSPHLWYPASSRCSCENLRAIFKIIGGLWQNVNMVYEQQ